MGIRVGVEGEWVKVKGDERTLCFQIIVASLMIPRVGSCSNSAVHIATRPRALRRTLSCVVCHGSESV